VPRGPLRLSPARSGGLPPDRAAVAPEGGPTGPTDHDSGAVAVLCGNWPTISCPYALVIQCGGSRRVEKLSVVSGGFAVSSDWSDNGFRTVRGPGQYENETTGASEVELRAESVVAETERLSEYDRTVYADDRLTIPGFGSSGPGCGEYRPSGVCESCGEPTFAPHRCGTRTCGDCWGSWAKESSLAATERVQAYRTTQPPNHQRQTGHFVYSPNEVPTTLRGLREMRTAAKETAVEKGVRGGSLVLHGWRLSDEAMEIYREVEPDRGAWVWVRETFGGEWKTQVEWSPHVHVVGLMSPGMTEGGESGDSGVWHLIRTFDRYGGANDRNSHNDVYGAFRYLLSHAIVPGEETDDNIRSRSWFGELHGSKFSPEEEVEPWKLKRLRRVLEEVADGVMTDESAKEYREEEDSIEAGECPCDDCEGVVIEVMRLDEYLRQAEPPPEVAETMEVCHDYRMGRLQAPPGLRSPSCEDDARAVIEELRSG
jgi:hypothetical protein